MSKRLLVALLVLALLLTACSGKKKEEEKIDEENLVEDEVADEEEEEIQESEAEEDEEDENEEVVEEEPEKEKVEIFPIDQGLYDIGFVLVLESGQGLWVGQEVDEVETIFKESEPEIIGYSDYDDDVAYYYLEDNGASTSYYKSVSDPSNTLFVDYVSIRDPKHATSKGLRPGDTYEDMVRIYGNPSFDFDDETVSIYAYSSNDDNYPTVDLYISFENGQQHIESIYLASNL